VPREETTPRSSTPVIQTGIQPAVQGTGNTNKRCFRLPTGLPRSPHLRTSGLTPLQAEDVEFETRLTSYSDDELNSINANSRKMTKEEWRRSKDDAWVDILVARHSRRAVLAATACVRSAVRSLSIFFFPFSFWLLQCCSQVCFLMTLPAALFTSPPNSTATPSTTMRSPRRAPLQ